MTKWYSSTPTVFNLAFMMSSMDHNEEGKACQSCSQRRSLGPSTDDLMAGSLEQRSDGRHPGNFERRTEAMGSVTWSGRGKVGVHRT